MTKKILITGATDGIGLLTVKKLASLGKQVLIHGRNLKKMENVKQAVKSELSATVDLFEADLSNLSQVDELAKDIIRRHDHIDVVINNAGVYKVPEPITDDNLDVRYVVNTLSPYLLTKKLLPLMDRDGRVINLSSAAQAPVDLKAIMGDDRYKSEHEAYSQSKLAITMWSLYLSTTLKNNGPAVIAVNPGSLLASKMVKEGFGVEGKDLNIGADILVNVAMGDDFKNA